MSNFDSNLMDWDSAIESDGQQFIVLPEGDYAFTVTGFERGRYPGSAKLPPCNKAWRGEKERRYDDRQSDYSEQPIPVCLSEANQQRHYQPDCV